MSPAQWAEGQDANAAIPNITLTATEVWMKRIARTIVTLLGALNDCVPADIIYPRTVCIAAITAVGVEVVADLTGLRTNNTIAARRTSSWCCAIFITATAGIGVAIVAELALNTVLPIATNRRDTWPRAICIAATTAVGKAIIAGFDFWADFTVAAAGASTGSRTISVTGSAGIGETIVTDLKERLQDTVTADTVALTNG